MMVIFYIVLITTKYQGKTKGDNKFKIQFIYPQQGIVQGNENDYATHNNKII